jgi:hypothetical protein
VLHCTVDVDAESSQAFQLKPVGTYGPVLIVVAGFDEPFEPQPTSTRNAVTTAPRANFCNTRV